MIQSEAEKKEALLLYDDFCFEWNKIREIHKVLHFGCDEIKIPYLSRESKFLYNCLTNTKNESLGIFFYVMLTSLLSAQNAFIE